MRKPTVSEVIKTNEAMLKTINTRYSAGGYPTKHLQDKYFLFKQLLEEKLQDLYVLQAQEKAA